ncbi:MAG: hypothetical protein EOO41_00035 [Methanobacteriota archaeon]|nr:MAG: hypothetical protein EOO41_00035 [Euryarchaeota archaeon]
MVVVRRVGLSSAAGGAALPAAAPRSAASHADGTGGPPVLVPVPDPPADSHVRNRRRHDAHSTDCPGFTSSHERMLHALVEGRRAGGVAGEDARTRCSVRARTRMP